MKKILFFLILFILQSNYDILMAWDTTAAKYFPLQVGNTWVYKGEAWAPGPYHWWFYSSYTITGTVDTLGKTYYKTQIRSVQRNGDYSCTILNFTNLVRIDSSTMNIYLFSPFCNSNEWFLDSLNAKKNDTAIICWQEPFIYYSACVDTNMYFIFSNYVLSKKFQRFTHPFEYTVYAKDIGIVYYRLAYALNNELDSLKGCVINGVLRGDTSMIVGLKNISSEITKKFNLFQNYPNPFNSVTKIRFDVPTQNPTPLYPPFDQRGDERSEGGFVTLKIYDILGREAATLVNQPFAPGTYEVEWPANDFPSGVYYYKLTAGSFSETKKMVLIK